MAISLAVKKCLTCRDPLVAGERLVCTRCTGRATSLGRGALRFGAHLGAAAAGDVLRREFPSSFATLEAGYRSWRTAEARRGGAAPNPQTSSERAVVDLGAARARKAGQ